LCLAVSVLAGAAAFANAQSITEFPITTAGSGVLYIAPGSDGNLWFTENSAGKIGRITTAGAVTEFPLPSATSHPQAIAAGPDGAMWITEAASNKIARITTAGVVTEFTVPSGTPQFITGGPDQGVWFTEVGNHLGRISTTAPNTIVEYPTVLSTTNLGGITTGPDGNIWFTELDHDKSARVARIDLTKLSGCPSNPSLCITEWVVPDEDGRVLLRSIKSGPDGALWFAPGAFPQNGKIDHITTSGGITHFPLPTAAAFDITQGPDGAMWYTAGTVVGRITTSGVVPSEIAASSPLGIASGPDGNIWFTEGTNKIGRVNLSGGGGNPTPTPTPTLSVTPTRTPTGTSGGLPRGHVTPIPAKTPKSGVNGRQ
jgi:virginiamycin B lyase